MDKQRRWQRAVILLVTILTIYNILPTVFFYTKPLKTPIDAGRAKTITTSITNRVNHLESDAQEWLHAFCSLLNIKASTISQDVEDPSLIHLTFKKEEDAKKFETYLPRAGSLISFVPAQLSLYKSERQPGSVTVQRRIPLHFDTATSNSSFQFVTKTTPSGAPTEEYKTIIYDRAAQIIASLGNTPTAALYVQALYDHKKENTEETALALANYICACAKAFPKNSPILERFFATLTQVDSSQKQALIENTIQALETAKTHLDPKETKKASTFQEALSLIKTYHQAFLNGKSPLNYQIAQDMLARSGPTPRLSMGGRNPLVEFVSIDWEKQQIYLHLFADFVHYRASIEPTAYSSIEKENLEHFLYDIVSNVSRQTAETINPDTTFFTIPFSHLQESKSLLAFDLGALATIQAQQIEKSILLSWEPLSPDLRKDTFPIRDYTSYQSEKSLDKELGLVIYAPAAHKQSPPAGFRTGSIYVIAKGWNKIVQRLQTHTSAEAHMQFTKDFNALLELLQQKGFLGYPAYSGSFGSEYSQDFIFEAPNYYYPTLQATREQFTVQGSQRYATLEFTNVEQRILEENKIETRIHEDLLKWRDDYRAAQLHMKGSLPFDVPKPTKSPLWSNFTLSFAKYFRGDERKILHWGLDLSGGKTVQIEMKDTSGKPITNEADIKQGISELYARVNKMGVSEVTLRQEGNYITLDFPGSQNLSAAELVKASSMYFHVVNEKFGTHNTEVAGSVNTFLQNVWNEAVVTNRTGSDDIQRIAWRHFYGEETSENATPRGELAQFLHGQGLRLAHPDSPSTTFFNDTLSKVAKFRGEDYTDWHGQTHPLLIVFHNYALEGASLNQIHASYDPTKGNFLSFTVQSSRSIKGEKFYPQEDLYAWTSVFSKEKVTGTPSEAYSGGLGWRMAVILNGSVINAPTLDTGLRDSAMITGSFSQREVNQLEADLKAGSLSFTPHILSERNVSPELGLKERSFGILATVIALTLVIGIMLFYYKFAGIVASIAVLFNLIIIWATLQNLQATLSLASIAGIILTLGMAVDANVLVFERVREELTLTGRIAAALQAGYKKAFSAIVDSNLTTIIAGLILLQFDSGPIKAFAITLIIGVISSMFTALFMTRYFFTGWAQNPKNKQLKMAQFINSAHFNFLRMTKPTVIVSACVVLLGVFACFKQKEALLGMDFTGGYALTLDLPKTPEENYRARIEKALIAQGASSKDFQVRELTPSNHVRLFLSRSLEKPGNPLYRLESETTYTEVAYTYENFPKIIWVVQALEKQGILLDTTTLEHLADNWTQISGQISGTMRNQALLGLCIALICIFIYIAARFEWTYAAAATLCTAHDVIFTIAALALLNIIGVPVHIDLNTTVALMTIIGYSLNDTIIVFDRIREDIRTRKKAPLQTIINHALNATLSRTTLTSGTTLCALLPLILLGGSTIFGFALVMAIGVVFGTLSSLFIAAPLMEYFHNRELKKESRLLSSS